MSCPAALAVPAACGLLAGPAGAPQCHKASLAPALGLCGSLSEQARSRRKAALANRAFPAPRLQLSPQLPRFEIRLRRVPPSSLLPIRADPAAPPSSLPFSE